MKISTEPRSAARSSTLDGVSESATEIRKHIEVLSSFEVEYAEFIHAVEALRKTGERRWSDQEFAERKRAIQKKSVRADLDVKASGANYLGCHDGSRPEVGPRGVGCDH